jgi:hypothetical protein
MKRIALLLASVVCLAGCEMMRPASTSPALPPRAVEPLGGGGLSGPIDLGDWRRLAERPVAERFSDHINRRWEPGAPLSTVGADLTRQGFACDRLRLRRTDGPAQSCTLQRVDAGCTHIWIVSLYDEPGAARLERLRSIYDRRCGRDGLAGGPD